MKLARKFIRYVKWYAKVFRHEFHIWQTYPQYQKGEPFEGLRFAHRRTIYHSQFRGL